jgi:peptide/nickel transport system permease protein
VAREEVIKAGAADLTVEETTALSYPGGSVEGERPPEGASPWRLAGRRLRRDKTSLAFGALFILLVLACLAAPLWANEVAHRGPNDQPGSAETVTIDGEEKPILGEFFGPEAGIPIGPTWRGEYFFGADGSGRDVMVRLLYGGRNSLLIGIAAALLTTLFGVLFGVLSGYLRGWTDTVISRVMDIVWAFPVILLGIALGTSLALGGFEFGPISVSGSSLAIPIFVISVVYIPYLARPIRGQVLGMREKEFVEAARAQGMGSWRIMVSEVLPNVASTVLVFFPLLVANAVLLEAALSFLGAGVQPPEPSWGTMIEEGVDRIVTAPTLAIIPGVMLVLTVLSLNVFGDGVRDALDPRAKIRIEH